jgi:hypothetical protein
LRELISNASDALDKIRLMSLTNEDALAANEELTIKIKVRFMVTSSISIPRTLLNRTGDGPRSFPLALLQCVLRLLIRGDWRKFELEEGLVFERYLTDPFCFVRHGNY